MEALPEECSSNISKRKAFSVSESSAHSVRERSSSGTYLALPNPSPRTAIMSELLHTSGRQRKVPIPILCARSQSFLVREFLNQ